MAGKFHMADVFDLVSFNGQSVQTFHSRPGFMDRVRDLEVRDDDLFITSYPKSGTNWVASLIMDINFGRGQKAAHPTTILEIEPTPRLIAVVESLGGTVNKRLEDSASMPTTEQRVFASHLWYTNLPRQVQEGKGKIVYIWRNPKDVAVSFYHMMPFIFSTVPGENVPQEISWPEYLQQFLYEDVMMGKWWDHVKNFMKNRTAKNLLILRFEDMKHDLPGAIRKIAAHLGREISVKEVNMIAESCGFEATKKLNPDNVMVRQGQVGKWRNVFTDEQNEAFDRVLSRQMAGWEDVIDMQFDPLE